jgi:acetolactate synthase-1/2/3 large subunit
MNMAKSADNGGAIIAGVLAAQGVKQVFTLCGGHISPILVESKARGIKIIDVRDEGHAVFAADAAARMTGIPGIAAVTAGPGVTNTITAIKNAQMAQSPLILFGGAAATVLKGRGSLQDIDQLVLMKPLCKWATSITSLSDMGPAVEKAFEIAKGGVPGPVFLEVPIDLLYREAMVREWYMKESGVEKAKGLGARAMRFYLENHLQRQFHGKSLPKLELPVLSMPTLAEVAAQLPPAPRNTTPQVQAVAAALARAERPVLVIGSQALVNVREPEKIAAAVRRLGIPTYLGGMSRGLLGRHDALQFRHARGKALKEADLVIIAGFPFDFRLSYGRAIGSKATLVSANLSARDLRKNRRPEIALQMHPGEFLDELAGVTAAPGARWNGWFETLKTREAARDQEIGEQAAARGQLVNPLDFMLKLEKQLADDAILGVHPAPARAAVVAGSRRVRHPRRRRRLRGGRRGVQAWQGDLAHLRRRLERLLAVRVRHLRAPRRRAHRGHRQRRRVGADRPRPDRDPRRRRGHGAAPLRLPQGRRGLRRRGPAAHRPGQDRVDHRRGQEARRERQAGLHQRAHRALRVPQGLHLDVSAPGAPGARCEPAYAACLASKPIFIHG